MAVGGYTSAFLFLTAKNHLPFLQNFTADSTIIGLTGSFFVLGFFSVLGGLVSAGAGYLLGLPSLRLRGDYLAIVTLGFGEIIRVCLLNIDAVGGAKGLIGIPKLTNLFSGSLIVALSFFVMWRLICTKLGRSQIAVREDELAAEAMGVHTTQAKVRGFVIGAFFAGIAGSLFAFNLCYLNPSIFDFKRSFEIIIMVVLGGIGSMTGSTIAAFLLTITQELLRPLQEITKIDFRMIIYSLILIILMLTRPNGLFGKKELRDFFKRPAKT